MSVCVDAGRRALTWHPSPPPSFSRASCMRFPLPISHFPRRPAFPPPPPLPLLPSSVVSFRSTSRTAWRGGPTIFYPSFPTRSSLYRASLPPSRPATLHAQRPPAAAEESRVLRCRARRSSVSNASAFVEFGFPWFLPLVPLHRRGNTQRGGIAFVFLSFFVPSFVWNNVYSVTR